MKFFLGIFFVCSLLSSASAQSKGETWACVEDTRLYASNGPAGSYYSSTESSPQKLQWTSKNSFKLNWLEYKKANGIFTAIGLSAIHMDLSSYPYQIVVSEKDQGLTDDLVIRLVFYRCTS